MHCSYESTLFPEFSREEIAELCFDYLAQFNDKTKESTKEKSLKKYLTKEFWIQREEENEEKSQTFSSFSSIFFCPQRIFKWQA